ncbi:MAG: GDP-mannose 4,6-dehydratase [Pseudonocardiaceae bacterium]
MYGEQDEQPISETAVLAPSSPYGTSKLAADQAATDLAASGAIGACEPGTWRAYNIGSGCPSSVHEVIATAEAVTGRVVPRRHTSAAHEPATLWADCTRIQSELGWRPEKSHLPEIISGAWTAVNSE